MIRMDQVWTKHIAHPIFKSSVFLHGADESFLFPASVPECKCKLYRIPSSAKLIMFPTWPIFSLNEVSLLTEHEKGKNNPYRRIVWYRSRNYEI